jgi:hypothetical protein
MSNVSIKIDSNAGEIADLIERKVRSQVPFVASVAVNNTLTKIRDQDLIDSYERVFETRNRAFLKQLLYIARSTKSQARTYGKVMGSIQEKMLPTPPGTLAKRGKIADTSFMRRHVSGGVKSPHRQSLAIPLASAPVSRTKAGGIRTSQKPRQITDRKRGFRAGNKIGFRKNKKDVVWMYHLAPSARIDRRWNPYGVARAGVQIRMKREFTKAWINALRTMRL